MTVLVLLFAAALSAVLYRLGGAAKTGVWYDWAKHSKTRDWGCTAVSLLLTYFLFKLEVEWYWLLLTWLGMWGAISTYFDSVFGYDNHYAHGFMIAFAYIFHAIELHNWLGLTLHCIVLCIAMGEWSRIHDNDIWEECGRGALMQLTLPLLLIGG